MDPISNSNIEADIQFLASYSYSSNAVWETHQIQINAKANSIANQFTQLSQETFKSLTPKIQALILDRVLEQDVAASQIADYLEDAACSQLVNEGRHVEKLASYYLQKKEEGMIALHSRHLDQQAISRYLTKLPPEQKESIEKIDLSNCDGLHDVLFLRNEFPLLKEINLSGDYQISTLEGLEDKSSLERVHIDRCTHLTSLEPLAQLPIKELTATRCPRLAKVAHVAVIESLEKVNLSHNTGISDWDIVDWTKSQLKSVRMTHVPKFGLIALQQLSSAKTIKEADVSYTTAAKDRNAFTPKFFEKFTHKT